MYKITITETCFKLKTSFSLFVINFVTSFNTFTNNLLNPKTDQKYKYLLNEQLLLFQFLVKTLNIARWSVRLLLRNYPAKIQAECFQDPKRVFFYRQDHQVYLYVDMQHYPPQKTAELRRPQAPSRQGDSRGKRKWKQSIPDWETPTLLVDQAVSYCACGWACKLLCAFWKKACLRKVIKD